MGFEGLIPGLGFWVWGFGGCWVWGCLGGFRVLGEFGFWGFKTQASRFALKDSGLGAVQGRTVSMQDSMLCLPGGAVEIFSNQGL